MAHPKHAEVRQRYGFQCGYCGVTEHDAGGELTVDHYRPVSHGGGDSDDNLVYACHRCNLYKGDFWPDAADTAAGRRVLHPAKDDLATHIREGTSGFLEPLTPTGAFHVALLHLNRPQLRARREVRGAIEQFAAHAALLTEIVHLQQRTIRAMRDYLDRLESNEPSSGSEE